MTTEVEKILIEKKVFYRQKGGDLLVRCLNPEHDDDNPSLRIDKNEGHFQCFSCGFKGNIFTYYNKYRNIFNSKVRKLQDKLSDIRRDSSPGLSIPEDMIPFNEMFRDIPARIFKLCNAFRTDEMGMADRLVFPIYDHTERVVGFQGRHLNSSASPKYLAYPPNVSLNWYPNTHRITPINNSILLTEGIIDALYLHGQDITNAVTTFGTKSVNADNIVEHLTPYMLIGVQKVYILMDGDSAGRSAAKHIERCITQKTDLIAEILELPEGKDPATAGDVYIKNLKKHLKYN